MFKKKFKRSTFNAEQQAYHDSISLGERIIFNSELRWLIKLAKQGYSHEALAKLKLPPGEELTPEHLAGIRQLFQMVEDGELKVNDDPSWVLLEKCYLFFYDLLDLAKHAAIMIIGLPVRILKSITR